MDTIKVIESQQSFAKSVYLDFMSKRFGITQTSITDLQSSISQKYLCDWQNAKKDVPGILEVTYDTFTPTDTSDPCGDVNAPTWCILCADGSCSDQECLIVSVVDSLGNPIKDFEIYIDGTNSGFTNEDGEFLYTFENASVDTKHTIQVCYCFETVGGCRQQKITIIVEADESAEECKVLTPCIDIKKKIIDELLTQVQVFFNDVLKYTQQCSIDLKFTLKNQDGDLIDATFNGYDIVVTQPVVADATVKNSDISYTASVASGATLILPDEDITVNGASFLTKPSVKNQDIILQDQNAVVITPTTISNNKLVITKEDASVNNSDSSYTASVASGGTLALPDITVSNSDDSYSVTSPSVINVEVPDEAITVNSAAFITKPSKKDQDILLKDVSGTTITPVSLSGNTITILDAVVDTGWSRPTEWIALPAVETKTLYGLYLVFENSPNTLSVLAKGAGDMEIDWENDGTVVTSTGSIQSYTYDYATLGGAISVYTEDGSNRNYKQVIFKMKHIANFTNGTYTRLDSNNGINDNGSNQFADINADFSGISTRFHLSKDKKQPYLRMLKVTDVGTDFRFWYGQQDLDLKVFDVPNPFEPEYLSFNRTTIAHGLNDLNPIGTACLTDFKCVSVNNIGGSKDLDGGSFGFCNNINSTESTSLCHNADINILGTVTLTDTNFQRAFQNCTTKKLIFASLPSQPTNMASNGGCFLGMVNLEEMIVPGLQNGFTIANSNMGATALDAMFTSLGTANGTQTITITGNPGAATATTSIATAKGFTIVI